MENGEENPAISAAAAVLVSKLSGPLKATKELQDKEERPPPSLEDTVLKSLTTGGTVFLNQKRLFDMLPGPILAMISSECGLNWLQPPLAFLLVNDRTRHLALYLTKPSYAYCHSKYHKHKDHGEDGDGWTPLEVELLCRKIAQESRNSLRSLDITIKPPWADCWEEYMAKRARTTGQSDPTAPQSSTPGGPDERPLETHPGVTAAQLCALLQEVRGLVKLHLEGDFKVQEIDSIVSTLADTNPGIRELRIPRLSKESLTKIADTWPELESLDVENTPEFYSSDLATVLPGLKNLQRLQGFHYFEAKTMIYVAHHHDHSTPPYKLCDSFFDCYDWYKNPAIGSEMIGKLLDAFPAVNKLHLTHKDIPMVCAGLQGRSHIGITKLKCDITESNDQPRVLEPLLALIGKNLRELEVVTHSDGNKEDSMDVSMVGHYCPNLQDLNLFVKRFVAGDQYKVTPSYFLKLKSFSLFRPVSFGPIHLPDPLVFRLLTGPHLENFEICDLLISEEVMASIAAESGEQRALSSLKRVNMESWCASVEVIATLLSHAPRLRELLVQGSESETAGVLTAFLHQTGLRASLDTS